MSLFDDISKAISKFLQEPPKPLVTSPPCKNCYYIKDNLCTKRNMPIEYDRTKICPYFTQEQPVTSMPTSLTESDIALLREALGKEITLQILDDINTYRAKESTLQTLKTDVAKESTLQTVLGKITSVDDKVALQTTLNVLKTDIADMKAIIGDLKGIKVFSVIEKKGGQIDLTEYSTDTVTSKTLTPNEEWKAREFTLSTPTPPSEVTVFLYALMIAIEQYASNVAVQYKVIVDGSVLKDWTACGTAYAWVDLAKDISIGSHTVEFWFKNTGASNYTAYLRGTRGICGIGTTSTSSVKIATISTSGKGSALGRVAGKSWATSYTVEGTVKVDESAVEQASGSVTVSSGGTEYTKDISLTDTVAKEEVEVYAKTSNANAPVYGRWSEAKMEKLYMGE